MTAVHHDLARPLRLLLVGAILSAACGTSGCNADDPSGLAGTIEVPERTHTKFVSKKSAPTKVITKKAPQ
jgi:hypothetical protein